MERTPDELGADEGGESERSEESERIATPEDQPTEPEGAEHSSETAEPPEDPNP